MTNAAENSASGPAAGRSAITPPPTLTGVSGPASASHDPPPAFAVLAVGARPARYRINDAAFDRWCDSVGDALEYELPEQRLELAGAAVGTLVDDAVHAGVIEGDQALQLDCYGDDDSEMSGFYVLLHNRGGEQKPIYLTSGWHEVLLADDDADPRTAAREHLETVCYLANTVIDGLYPQRVAGATATILTVETPEGSCATWILPECQADAVEALITNQCGPADSLRC